MRNFFILAFLFFPVLAFASPPPSATYCAAAAAGPWVPCPGGASSSTPSYTKPLSTVITETVTASTVTTGGAAQTALASSTSRNGCQILNTSTGTENIDINSTPVTVIQPGGVYTCNVAANQVTQQTIYILGATTGQGYVVSSW